MAEERVDHIFSLLTPTTSWTPVGNKQARHNQKTHDWGRNDLIIFKDGQKVAWTKLGKMGHFLNVSQITIQSKDHLKIRRQNLEGTGENLPSRFKSALLAQGLRLVQGVTWAKHHSLVVNHCACRAANVMDLSQRMSPSAKQHSCSILFVEEATAANPLQLLLPSPNLLLGFPKHCGAADFMPQYYFRKKKKASWLVVEDEEMIGSL